MKAELREKILAYNRAMAERKEKAEDMDVIGAVLLTLPPGQLKKLLTPEVLAVLDKYGKTYNVWRGKYSALRLSKNLQEVSEGPQPL